jgi:hypothetical protein
MAASQAKAAIASGRCHFAYGPMLLQKSVAGRLEQ